MAEHLHLIFVGKNIKKESEMRLLLYIGNTYYCL